MTNAMETTEIEKNVLYGGPELFDFGCVKSIGHLLVDLLEKHSDRVAFIDAITDDSVTYQQVLRASIDTANSLRAFGLKAGDTIGIISENRLEFPIPFLAALLIGVTVAPINLTYTEREIIHALGLSQPKLLFTSSAPIKQVLSAVSHTNFIQQVIQFGAEPFGEGTMLFQDFIKYKEPNRTKFVPVEVDIHNHNALILCSSGTTGLPKGVQLSHSNVVAAISFFKYAVIENAEKNKNVDEVKFLGNIPFFHAYGALTLIGVCATGSKMIIMSRFEEEFYFSCIEKHKISMLFAVPPLMILIAKHPRVDKYNISSVSEIVCGAAPLSAETAAAVENRLKNQVNIRQGYGMSETTLSVIMQRIDSRKPGSVGILSRATYCKVIDPDTGKILGKNQAGELCFKGTQIMRGYKGNDEATRNTIDEDGWLHTGDLGYYDDDYHFFIVDRLKELIKYKGYQVPPAELESVLLTNSKIKDAAVIGLPDEMSGELPLAFVVLQPGAQLTENEVIKYVQDRVSAAKRLRGGVKFIDAIPKNMSGKILRRELRALLAKQKL